jgi:hypothetical protein
MANWDSEFSIDEYMKGISLIISTPIKCQELLDVMGIDCTEISSYELFCLMSNQETFKKTLGMILRIDGKVIEDFEIYKRVGDGALMIRDCDNDISITEEVYNEIFDSVVEAYELEDSRNPIWKWIIPDDECDED